MRSIRLLTFCAAAALAGCGHPGAGDGSHDSALQAVDPSDPTQLTTWLAANEIEHQPVITEAATRGAARSAKAIFLLYPRGETRVEALNVYALEVAASPSSTAGHVEFRRGREVLYREPAPFTGSLRFVQGLIPVQVREAIKPGESLTWGVFFDDGAEANSVAVVRVIKKTAADKQIVRLENDRRNSRQPALVRALGRSQLLFNNGLYGEALAGYMALADEQPSVGESWTRIVECMRRLELRDTPLYGDALSLMTGTKGGAMSKGGAALAVNGMRPGGALPLRADPSATPTAPTAVPTPVGGAVPGAEGTGSPNATPESGQPSGPSEPNEPNEPSEPSEPTPPSDPNGPTPPAPHTAPTPGQPGNDAQRRAAEAAQMRADQATRDLQRLSEAVSQAAAALAAAQGDPEAEASARAAFEQAQRDLEQARGAAAAAREALDRANREALEAGPQGPGSQEPTHAPASGDRTLERLQGSVTQLEAQARAAMLAAQTATDAANQARTDGDPQADALQAEAAAQRDAAQLATREAARARRELERLAAATPSSIR